MSQENVEIVRQASDAFARRDWDSLADVLDPNVEQHGTVGGVEEGQVARGIDQVRQIWETEENEIWDEHRLEPQQFFHAGDRVVIFQREYQRGKSSGVELVVERRPSSICGMGASFASMDNDPAAALRAAGLPAQDSHR